MKLGHCTELLLSFVSHIDEDTTYDNWELEHSFRTADTWLLTNPLDSSKHVQIKIHGSGLNIDVYTAGNPNMMCFWLSTNEHLPQLDLFFQENLFNTGNV